MDSMMASLTVETKSMCLDIDGFQSRLTGLEQHVAMVEAHISSFQDRDQELLYLCSKITDLEDRSHRDNVRFLRFPENLEGTDIHSPPQGEPTLPKLTGLPFDPPPPGVSESTQTRPQATGQSQPLPPNHSLPLATPADPPTPASGLHAWTIPDGRVVDPDDC
ncbi:hypothetical protein NDU88_007699 [Pleurodeles waltl]|uniref:Uncharacterized protein n=1 Tax=Pleurodeles waltl TaxID=8319 RepID=A0AAV7QLG2_PLEWA|nr:hypothetical protein NDU88_007699 [Pleurodeles waltl]